MIVLWKHEDRRTATNHSYVYSNDALFVAQARDLNVDTRAIVSRNTFKGT